MSVNPGRIIYSIFIPRAIREGWSQRQFFAWARLTPGVWTVRESVMRAKWHELDAAHGYTYAIGQLREDQLIPKSLMSPLWYENRQSPYTITVRFLLTDDKTGGQLSFYTTIRADIQLTKEEAIQAAQDTAIKDWDRTGRRTSDWRVMMVEDQELGFAG